MVLRTSRDETDAVSMLNMRQSQPRVLLVTCYFVRSRVSLNPLFRPRECIQFLHLIFDAGVVGLLCLQSRCGHADYAVGKALRPPVGRSLPSSPCKRQFLLVDLHVIMLMNTD
jgi:hypothetical protein